MGFPGRHLSEYDCFALGQKAMESDYSPIIAIEWFEEAKRRAGSEFAPFHRDACIALAELYARVSKCNPS